MRIVCTETKNPLEVLLTYKLKEASSFVSKKTLKFCVYSRSQAEGM